ncbi:hypothetical protein NFI96_006840 [Prochilodus magdalenae]|nr:hypothetical protein NFI96_006840 [Prochilodus magdalenae]
MAQSRLEGRAPGDNHQSCQGRVRIAVLQLQEEHRDLRMQGRLRLRPWLEEQIKSGKYPGVMWLDETARVFQIPWKHAARHGWNIDKDATLFRNWAIHTGRYKPGIDKPDPKTWKANFRCALNSLPDVQELRDKSIKKGHNAFRVYILLPSNKTPKRRKGKSLDTEVARVGLPALLPHTNAPLERFTEAFWKYREDGGGVVPEVLAKHGYSAFPMVKEERSTDYCCSPAAVSTAAQGIVMELIPNLHLQQLPLFLEASYKIPECLWEALAPFIQKSISEVSIPGHPEGVGWDLSDLAGARYRPRSDTTLNPPGPCWNRNGHSPNPSHKVGSRVFQNGSMLKHQGSPSLELMDSSTGTPPHSVIIPPPPNFKSGRECSPSVLRTRTY